MEDLGELAPSVQLLDLPVLDRMDHLAELLNLEEDVLDAGRLVDHFLQVPELVIAVPKISLDVIPLRTLVPEPQLADQLVEVPTVLTPTRIAVQIAEQIVDTPVRLPESVEWVQLRDEAHVQNPISGTDVLARRSGSRRRASESSGLDRRLRGEGSGTGNKDTRVSTFDLPPLPPE